MNGTSSGGQMKCEGNVGCGYEVPAVTARAAIPSRQSLSIRATTFVETAGASIETSVVATPSAGSTAGKTSSFSVGAAAEIGVGGNYSCSGVRGCSFCLLVFFCVCCRRTAKEGHLNTAAPQIGSEDGELAAEH